MRIPGYQDSTWPLVDAGRWVDDELFWPAFLLQVGMAELAPAAFRADLADLDAYLDRFEDPGRWPVFTVPVGGGTMWLIVCNLPDDAGIDWVLDETAMAAVHADAKAAGGYQAGSGLPWSVLPPEPERLLLALPAAGDDIAPLDASDRVAAALRAVGAVDLADELADDLLEHRACILLR